MPLVSGKGPDWSRPLVLGAEQRLSGLNLVRGFFASLFRPRRRAAPAAVPPRGPEAEGSAGAGAE
jgi:hypothetical protein